MAEEELSVLAEIFCFPGELVHWRSGDAIHVNVKISEPCAEIGSHDVLNNFVLPLDYPSNSISEINITSSSLPADFISRLKEKLKIHAVTRRGEPMLLELIELSKESLNTLHNQTGVCQHLDKASIQQKKRLQVEDIQSCTDPDSIEKKQANCSSIQYKELWITLIQLDHMRSKSKYTKIIKNWSKNFNLSGRLIFCQKLILILLLGYRENLKAYLVQHKTACVDVDSRGHSCKERMMTVLTEEPYTATVKEGKNMGFSDFQAVECSSMAEVENIFKTVQLLPLYKRHVMK